MKPARWQTYKELAGEFNMTTIEQQILENQYAMMLALKYLCRGNNLMNTLLEEKLDITHSLLDSNGEVREEPSDSKCDLLRGDRCFGQRGMKECNLLRGEKCPYGKK